MKKKIILIVILIGVIILDLLALDDITTNKQENYFMEYLMLIFSAFAYAIIGIYFLKNKKSKKLH